MCPHGGTVEIMSKADKKQRSLAKKERKERVNVFHFIWLLASGHSLTESIQELVQIAGAVAIVSILLLGFMFFLPTIISGLRKAKLRWIICVVNLVFIAVAFFNIILPAVIWLVLMILAITGKKDVEKIETTGVKVTYVQKGDN